MATPARSLARRLLRVSHPDVLGHLEPAAKRTNTVSWGLLMPLVEHEDSVSSGSANAGNSEEDDAVKQNRLKTHQITFYLRDGGRVSAPVDGRAPLGGLLTLVDKAGLGQPEDAALKSKLNKPKPSHKKDAMEFAGLFMSKSSSFRSGRSQQQQPVQQPTFTMPPKIGDPKIKATSMVQENFGTEVKSETQRIATAIQAYTSRSTQIALGDAKFIVVIVPPFESMRAEQDKLLVPLGTDSRAAAKFFDQAVRSSAPTVTASAGA